VSRGTGQAGAAGLLVVVAVAFAAALGAQVVRLGAHAVAAARAQTAADAAALAAADTLALGRGADAARATAIATARENGARLEPGECDCTGRFVTVTRTVTKRPVAGVVAHARAEAAAEIRPILGR